MRRIAPLDFEELAGSAPPDLLSFLTTLEATSLRATSRTLRGVVAEHPWKDMKSTIYNLGKWRACFPLAREAKLRGKGAKGGFDLADVIHLRGIHVLDMRGSSLASISGVAIAANFTCMASLHLQRTGLADAGALTLANALRSMPHLEILRLSENGMEDAGFIALASALRGGAVPKLTHLEIDHDAGRRNFGVMAITALAAAFSGVPQLTSLRMCRCLDEDGAASLVTTLPLFLTELLLEDNALGVAGASALATALTSLPLLRVLRLRDNDIGDEFIDIFAALSSVPCLETLNLGVNSIEEPRQVAQLFAIALRQVPLLKHLILDSMDWRDSWLGDVDAFETIADALALTPKLESLKLAYNYVGEAGARYLAAVLQLGCLPFLRVLNLGTNSIGDEGLRAVAHGLDSVPLLSHLILSQNGIGEDGAGHLANALRVGRVPVLMALDLGNNNLGDYGSRYLAAGLSGVPLLRQLHMENNGIGDAGICDLKDALPSSFCELRLVVRIVEVELFEAGDE